MIRIIAYSGLLLLGMMVSQIFDVAPIRAWSNAITMVCLAYIMIEVGLEFTINKKKLKSYGLDYFVSASAAVLPWLFCAAYFAFFLSTDWKESLLVACFAAPTSAGVLFAMLAAAGLGATWIFKKAQVLAIFDDLFTILLLIPLKILFVGMKPELFIIIAIMFFLLFAAYRWLHTFHLPTGKLWLFAYGIGLTAFSVSLEHTTHVHLEVLLPAFALGCVLFNPHDPNLPAKYAHEHQFLEPEKGHVLILDKLIKSVFMFLVGLSLPKIILADTDISTVIWHVFWISILSNLGKCFPAFFYKGEASFRERLALSVTMFPRGEVGGGVLLIALGYGLTGLPATLAGLSLALNLILIGIFILIVKWLIIRNIMLPANKISI
jgi:Kef-type K+ transport system membrane component KefB